MEEIGSLPDRNHLHHVEQNTPPLRGMKDSKQGRDEAHDFGEDPGPALEKAIV
jgi:hypothetical protein